MTDIITFSAKVKYLHCNNCGKQVSSGYIPVPNEIDKNNIIIRAWIECPECIEKKLLYKDNDLPMIDYMADEKSK